MISRSATCLCLCLAWTAGTLADTAAASAWNELVAAERSFAAASIERGMRTAFLDFLAEDAIVFRPGPVDARPHFLSQPEAAGTLAWEPQQAEVSSDGNLGYTTGPWTFTPTNGTPAHGHYVSIWRRQDDGSWRVELDLGSSHPTAFATGTPLRPPRRAPRDAGDGADADLLASDRAFGQLAVRRGTRVAYRRHAGRKLRLHRPGLFPILGKAAVRRRLQEEDRRATWQVEDAETAGSGDLGYSYGTVEDAETARRYYLHIWKRRGPRAEWKLVLEVLLPVAE